MSSTHVQNDSEASSETQINFRVIRNLLFILFLEGSVLQIFEEHAVNRTELFVDFREATIQNDEDRLFRILMQILELGEENNDEDYAEEIIDKPASDDGEEEIHDDVSDSDTIRSML